jgi:ribonuclease BN (tRNA processing enzyme)
MAQQIGFDNKTLSIINEKKIYLILVIFIFVSCKSNKIELNSYQSENLKIEKISNTIFKHISYLETEEYGKVPCNGMVFVNKNEAIIFDTPTNDKASIELINWLGKKNIKAVVVTHFHIDCLGGLESFHLNGINSYSYKQTIELAKKIIKFYHRTDLSINLNSILEEKKFMPCFSDKDTQAITLLVIFQVKMHYLVVV